MCCDEMRNAGKLNRAPNWHKCDAIINEHSHSHTHGHRHTHTGWLSHSINGRTIDFNRIDQNFTLHVKHLIWVNKHMEWVGKHEQWMSMPKIVHRESERVNRKTEIKRNDTCNRGIIYAAPNFFSTEQYNFVFVFLVLSLGYNTTEFEHWWLRLHETAFN